MSIVYAQGSSSGDGYSATYRLDGPPLLAPDGRGVALARTAIQAAVYATAANAKRRAIKLYHVRTIEAAWEVSARTTGPVGVTVRNREPLLGWVDAGTRPHKILPRTAYDPATRKGGVLAWPGGAHPVRGVNHPGTPGKHRLAGFQAVTLADLATQLSRRISRLLTTGDSAGGEPSAGVVL